MWMLPKMFSKGGGTLVLHPFEPTAAHLLLFTLHGLWLNHGNWKTNCYSVKSCQRWLWSQRVDCGTDILSDQEASSAGLLSPQLHTWPWKPSVYLVYVGSPRRCHQSERWEKCPFDMLTIVRAGEKKKKKRKKRKLARPWAKFFWTVYCVYRKGSMATLFGNGLCAVSDTELSKDFHLRSWNRHFSRTQWREGQETTTLLTFLSRETDSPRLQNPSMHNCQTVTMGNIYPIDNSYGRIREGI